MLTTLCRTKWSIHLRYTTHLSLLVFWIGIEWEGGGGGGGGEDVEYSQIWATYGFYDSRSFPKKDIISSLVEKKSNVTETK